MAFMRKSNPPVQPGHAKVTCDRCGTDWHIRDTVVQKGLRLCKDTCQDEIDNQVRR